MVTFFSFRAAQKPRDAFSQLALLLNRPHKNFQIWFSEVGQTRIRSLFRLILVMELRPLSLQNQNVFKFRFSCSNSFHQCTQSSQLTCSMFIQRIIVSADTAFLCDIIYIIIMIFVMSHRNSVPNHKIMKSVTTFWKKKDGQITPPILQARIKYSTGSALNTYQFTNEEIQSQQLFSQVSP